MTTVNRVLTTTLACLSMLFVLAVPAPAQDAEPAEEAPVYSAEDMAMMEAWQKAMTPGDAHAALAESAGSWKISISSWMDPTAEPMTSEGTAERSMIMGGRILQEHVVSDMMGQPFNGVGHSGYDNTSGRHWATWMDSMSTGIYVSYGEEQDDGSIVYKGDYHDPMSGQVIKVRSVVRPETDGTQTFEWYEDRGEGEVKTMEIAYSRVEG